MNFNIGLLIYHWFFFRLPNEWFNQTYLWINSIYGCIIICLSRKQILFTLFTEFFISQLLYKFDDLHFDGLIDICLKLINWFYEKLIISFRSLSLMILSICSFLTVELCILANFTTFRWIKTLMHSIQNSRELVINWLFFCNKIKEVVQIV